MSQTATTVPASPCRIVALHRIPGGDKQPPTYHLTIVDMTTGAAMCATLSHQDAAHLAEVLTTATRVLG